MRTAPRKLRPFRPSAQALEAICPVSSLATALPAGAALAVELGTPRARHQQPDRRPSPAFPSMRLAPSGIGTSGGRGTGGGSDIATPSRVALNASPVPAAGVALGRYDNKITIAAANLPPARQPSGPAANQDTGGGGAIAAPGRPAATPPPASVAPPQGATFAAASPPLIRPMTLAATPTASTSSSPSGTATAYQTSSIASDSGYSSTSASTSTSNSTSSSTPPDKPPGLLVSGGNWGGSFESSPGHFVDPYFVPIGANITVMTESPAAGYDVQSVKWDGGTTYSQYTSQYAGDSAPNPLKIVSDVKKDQLMYSFIADSKGRAYTINADVTYTNGAHGSSQIIFTTQEPTTSLTVLSQGKTTAYTAGGNVGVQYDNWANAGAGDANFPANAGVRFQATTSTNLGGSFAFFQTTQPQMTAVVSTATGNRPMTWTNGVRGSALDTFSGGNRLGYETDSSSNSPGVYEWKMDPGAPSVKNNMSDTPYANNSGGNLVSVEVGTPAVPGGAAAAPMTFQTYLMYRGDGGSWVAVKQMNWSYSGGLITNGVGNLVVDPNNPLTNPPPTSATPPPLGPTADGLGKDYTWQFD